MVKIFLLLDQCQTMADRESTWENNKLNNKLKWYFRSLGQVPLFLHHLDLHALKSLPNQQKPQTIRELLQDTQKLREIHNKASVPDDLIFFTWLLMVLCPKGCGYWLSLFHETQTTQDPHAAACLEAECNV